MLYQVGADPHNESTGYLQVPSFPAYDYNAFGMFPSPQGGASPTKLGLGGILCA